MQPRNALLFSVLLFSLGCDPLLEIEDLSPPPPHGDLGEPLVIPIGALWGPCDLSHVDDPDWWGCDGDLGRGLACARPASDNDLHICVPQTADPDIDDDCIGVEAPTGKGVRLQGSAYCVIGCELDDDCAAGMYCAAAGLCAWLG